MIRDIVVIDEALCDGCGLCVPACAEGAIKIVDGKARLSSDALCDGLGSCLGECPKGAIRIEKREAVPFDDAAVAAHVGNAQKAAAEEPVFAGCPSARMFRQEPSATCASMKSDEADDRPSELTHWPVQLRLLPPNAPVLRGAHLLLAADCVPVACPDFHQKLLRGRSVAIACPKFDGIQERIAVLAETIRECELQDITVARMEVPCCTGILTAALEARRLSGREINITDMVVNARGEIISSREIPLEDAD